MTSRSRLGPLSPTQLLVLSVSLVLLIGSLSIAVWQPTWMRFGPSSVSADQFTPPPLSATPDDPSEAQFGSIEGLVKDQVGSPVAGVKVTLLVPGRQLAEASTPMPASDHPPASFEPAGKVIAQARTDLDGRFLLDQLITGQYWLSVQPRRGSGLAAQVMNADWVRNPIGGLYIGSKSRLVMEIPLSRAGRISGVVLSTKGRPTQAQVRAELSTAGGWIPQASVRASGPDGFSFAQLQPGTYRLVSSTPHAGTSYYPGVGADSAAQPVAVAAGRLAAVGEFQQAGPARLTGVVRRADGTPIAGATVRAIPQPDERPTMWRNDNRHGAVPRATTSDSTGRFSLSLPAGEYAIWAPPGKLAVPPGRCRPSVPRQRHVVAIAGATTPVELHSRSGGTLAGKLTASDGSPLAGIKVTLASQPSGEFRKPCLYRVATDGQGHYRRGGLADGDYQVRVDPPATYAYPLVSGRYLPSSLTKPGEFLSVAQGREVTGVSGRLAEAATVTVLLSSSKPKRLENLVLCARDLRRHAANRTEPCVLNSRPRLYHLLGLRPGVYLFTVARSYTPSAPARFLSRHGGLTSQRARALRLRVRIGETRTLHEVTLGRSRD